VRQFDFITRIFRDARSKNIKKGYCVQFETWHLIKTVTVTFYALMLMQHLSHLIPSSCIVPGILVIDCTLDYQG
jgi:hypothetical protein